MSHFPRSWRAAACATALVSASASFALAVTPSATAAPAPADTVVPVAATAAQQASVTAVRMPALEAAISPAGRTRTPSATTQVAPRGTKQFGMVGVTWARDTGLSGVTIEVRTRTGGRWSGWTDLEADHESGVGGAGTREGSEPLWVGKADGVAARVTSTSAKPPRDVRIDLVDPGTGPAAGSRVAAPAASVTAAAAPTYTPRPAIVSRAGWGARAAKSCDAPQIAQTSLGVVVHHTAGSNSYSKSQSAAIVRGVQAFHQNGRGWCDIGYNFLVDKYGQIFEGRAGGMSGYMVRGAHAGNFTVNTYALGVSMMGNLDTVNPPTAMRNAMVDLVGWWIGTRYLPATGTYAIAGKSLYRITGHRDVYNRGIRPATSTACPGRYGYAFLTAARTGLRARVSAYVAAYSTPIKTTARSMGATATGPVYVGETPTAGGYKTRFTKGDILYKNDTTGARWVAGAVKKTYGVVGGPTGKLGFPTSNLNGTGAEKAQRFEKGTIYQPSGAEAYAITTKVDDKYRELGQYDSELGAPKANVFTTSNNTDLVTFEHGTIRYNRTTGEYKVAVTG